MTTEFLAETYSGREFSQEDLQDVLFEECSFDQCRFQNVEFNRIIFRNCDFIGCQWLNVIFDEVKIQESRFIEGTILGLQAHHDQVKTMELSVSDSKMELCVFEELDLSRCQWKNCLVKESSFFRCQINGVSFEKSDLRGTGFEGCDLRKSSFELAVNYEISPADNLVEGAIFSSPAVLSLLQHLNIIIR